MGTHNRLLGLGAAYLEVIAIDPDAPPQPHARWFDLDNFAGAPRVTNWVGKTKNLAAAIQAAPDGIGVPTPCSRDDLSWTIAVSPEGTLPFQGAFPGFIDWGETPHPSTRLPESGAKLQRLTLAHPDAQGLSAALSKFDFAAEICTRQGAFEISATIETAQGPRVLK